MSRYFLQLSYFGKQYNGWQIQQNTKSTIQGVIQENLSILLYFIIFELLHFLQGLESSLIKLSKKDYVILLHFKLN